MNDTNLKRNVLSGLVWQFCEKFVVQFVLFAVQIVLARLLLPEDFGIIGIISVFNMLAQVFVQSGFGTALIQKKSIDDVDCSSIFYVSMLISALLYALIFFGSPFVAKFYECKELSSYMRVQFLGLFASPIINIQTALLQKKLDFKTSFIRNFIANLASAVVGISMAITGFGVWSLVFSNLTTNIVSAIVLTMTVRWLPKLTFSMSKVKELFSYGSKLLLSSLLDTLYNNMYSLVIGKFFDTSVLGYYNKGKNFPSLAVNTINGTIQTVIFPALSKCQDDKVKLKNLMRRSIVTSTFCVFPAMFGLAAVAKPLVLILLTEKWLPSVFFLQVCCFTYMLWPIHTANLQAINAIGRSDVFLKLEVIKKVVGVITLILTIPFGVHVMVIARAFTGIFSTFINAFPNKKLLNYSFFEQMKDILPSFVLSLVMFGCIYIISFLNINVYLMIVVQIVVGSFIYIFGAKLMHFECLDYIIQIIKGYIKR